MKKIILLISIMLSSQAIAYPDYITKENPPIDKKVDDLFINYISKNSPELNKIFIKLSKKQKNDFANYLILFEKSTNYLIGISLDSKLLVTNDVLHDKITIDEIYLDYVFYNFYPAFIKSYFTIQSIIKNESPELFKKNIDNAEQIANRKNKGDSYYAHLEEVKKEILQLVIDDKRIVDVNDFIKNSFEKEKEIFRDSIDKEKLAFGYYYTQAEINKYKKYNDKHKEEILNELNNKTQ